MASPIVDAPSRSRLSLQEWGEIERLFAEGLTSLNELSEQYSTPVRTIQAHLNKAGIRKGAGPRASEELDAPKSSFDTEVKAYQAEARRIALLMAEHVRAGLERLAPGPSHASQLLKLGSTAIKMNQFAKELGIAIEADEGMPVLKVIEITAEQIEQMRKQQREEDEELNPHLLYERVSEEENCLERSFDAEDDSEDLVICESAIDGPCCLIEEGKLS